VKIVILRRRVSGYNRQYGKNSPDYLLMTHCKLCLHPVIRGQSTLFMRRPLIGIVHKECYEREKLSGRTDLVLSAPES
jgi:hypothetical protein